MEYYGTKEASEILGLKQSTVSKKCGEGAFPGAEQEPLEDSERRYREVFRKTYEKIGEEL